FANWEAPAAKIRLSSHWGATLPAQLAAVDQLASAPRPVQALVAGSTRSSRGSSRSSVHRDGAEGCFSSTRVVFFRPTSFRNHLFKTMVLLQVQAQKDRRGGPTVSAAPESWRLMISDKKKRIASESVKPKRLNWLYFNLQLELGRRQPGSRSA